jgi:hypothetical protein
MFYSFPNDEPMEQSKDPGESVEEGDSFMFQSCTTYLDTIMPVV